MKRHWPRMIGPCCLLLAAGGCAGVWDELVSNERDWRYISSFNRPDPLLVIRDNPDGRPNSDGMRRAQALGQLREPLQHGGNAKDQDVYLEILNTSATKDTEPLCRLSAIRALGKFRDARAARILENVHQQPRLPFTPDNNHMIRKEALVALEMTKDPDAWKFLVRIARGPAPSPTADMMDRQQTQDEKIVAIRALGKYRQAECVDALKYVLRSEKDVALRDRALQSLEETTGKRWPVQMEAWQREDPRPLPGDANDNFIQRVNGWLPKW